MKLTRSEKRLHARAVSLCKTQRDVDSEIIDVLIKIDDCELYRRFECTSLFRYAVEILDLLPPVANSYITVARKAARVSPLLDALSSQELTVPKSLRFVSALNCENAEFWIEFAKTHTCKEIDQEVARQNPLRIERDQVSYLSGEMIRLHVSLAIGIYEKLERAQSLECQRRGSAVSLNDTLQRVLDFYLGKNDPVKKAERAKSRSEQCTYIINKEVPLRQNVPMSKRISLTSQEKHAVNLRDQGRCTYRNAEGVRCVNERWIAIHHQIPVSEGGGNDPSNLTTLCWQHHDMLHRADDHRLESQ